MKQLNLLIVLLLIFACDSENTGDCFQTSGEIITETFTVDTFDKVLVNRDIELVITDGSPHSVVVETGKNLLNDVSVSVKDGRLILTDNNTCNYVRDYGITKVYITSPNITEIRSSTQYNISSDGVLTYPSISILSEDFNAPDTFSVGDFILEINNSSFSALFNGISIAYISGNTNNLNVNFASGDSRFEGRNLVAEKVNIFHRSSNDIIVNPQQEITGKIVSTGNVISINTPPAVAVEALYNGQLIFE